MPIASQPARQPCSRIASCAISGIATSPAICASVATELAKVAARTNQLLSAP